jgi:hypothetical protein
MAVEFESIPDATRPAVDDGGAPAEPTLTLRELPAIPSRRSVLGALTFAAVGLGAGALTLAWPSGARKAFAENGPSGLRGFDDPRCSDAYPSGYGEVRDSSGAYTSANGYAAACVGGTYISHSYCRFGWHSRPRSDRCGPSAISRNSWRWTTPDGKVFRCSDGNTIIDGRSFFTVCRSRVG